MKIRQAYQGRQLYIDLIGEYLPGDSDEFLHQLNSLISNSVQDVIVDFSKVSAFSTHCMAKLTIFHNRLLREKRRLTCVGLSSQLKMLFGLLDMDYIVRNKSVQTVTDN
jgi:anti-anti-sigma regulatory factor